MTIKQYGGVFGRNPTFNDVTIDGELTFDGDFNISGDLGVNIGTDTPTTYVEVRTNGATGNDDFVNLTRQTYGNVLSLSRSSGDAVIQADKNLILRCDSGNNQTGANTNIIFQYDGSTESARFDASGNLAFVSGKGIDFSATAGTGTSELLSDYEEGVFSPVYAPTAGSFTTITTVSSGRYTKVGRLVTLFVSIRTSGALDVTGASGNLKITGLPFACNATLSGGGPDLSHQGWNLGTDILNTRISVPAGTSEIILYKNTMNGSSFPSGNITVPEMSTSGSSFANLITFTASYEV